jgi:predicted transcriptional regulator
MSEAEIKKPASGLRAASRRNSDLYNAAYEATLRRFETSRSFTIPSELAKKLEEIAAESGLTESEILRTGIGLVELAVKAREKGKKFGVVEQDTPLVTEVVGL